MISFALSLSCSLCMKQASDAQRKSVLLQGQENVRKPDVLFCKTSMAHIFCGLSMPVGSAAVFVFPSVQQECSALTLRLNLDIKVPVYGVVYSLTSHANKAVTPLCWNRSQTKYLCVPCCVEFDIACVVHNSMWNFRTHTHTHTCTHTHTHTHTHSVLEWSKKIFRKEEPISVTSGLTVKHTHTHAHYQAYRYK